MAFALQLTAEQLAIRRTVREFVNREIKPIAVERDRLDDFDERFPREALVEASQLGLRTFSLSEENGGGGADGLTSCIVAEELAAGDAGFAATLVQTSALAQAWFDLQMTEEQRDRFLPDFLADHEYHLATAGHEPDSDLGWCYHRPVAPGTGYQTTAERDADGNWVINGIKNFITNAGVAKLIAVEARTEPLAGGSSGISTILVPGDAPGLTVYEHDKVGRRLGSNAELVFDNVRVPAGNLLGREGASPRVQADEGALRGRGMPRFQALNLGIGRAAYEAALEFAKLRVQGGRPIVEHQSVALALADMTVSLEAARVLIWQAAWASDHREAYADESLPDLPLQTIAKIVTSETVQRVTLQAAQIFGGMGVMRDLPMQKYVRDAMMFLHSEQSNDVARMKLAETLVGYRRPG